MKSAKPIITGVLLTASVFFHACQSNGKHNDSQTGVDSTQLGIDTVQSVSEDTTVAIVDSLVVDSAVVIKDTVVVPVKSEKPTSSKPKSTKTANPKTNPPKSGSSSATVNKAVFKQWRMDTSVGERDGGYTYRVDGSFNAPPSRMWSIIDIKANGDIVKRGPGANDAGVSNTGRWVMVSPKELKAEYKDGTKQKIKIITVENGSVVLKIDPQ